MGVTPRVCIIVVKALVLGLQRRAQGIEVGRVERKADEEGLVEGERRKGGVLARQAEETERANTPSSAPLTPRSF